MTTEIILTDQNTGTQYSLDLTEDVNLLLTFQCGDVRTVLSKNSSYSKTVSIMGTSTNNRAFKNLFDIRNYSDFNPNLFTPVTVKSGGITIFTGNLKVDSIKITNENLISYECSMYAAFNDLFTELSTLRLNQLSFQEFNHVYNQSNVTGSWETYVVYNGVQASANAGFGYVYPYVDLATDSSITNIKYTEFFKPCFYAKTVLDKIFAQTDYTYKSDFLTSDYFKSLIIVPSPDSFALCAQTVTNAQLWASEEYSPNDTGYTRIGTSYTASTFTTNFGSIAPIDGYHRDDNLNDYNVHIYGSLPFTNSTVDGRYDYGNNFNTTLYKYTVPVTGWYNIVANVTVDAAISNAMSGTPYGTIPAIGIGCVNKYLVELTQVSSGMTIPLAEQNVTLDYDFTFVNNNFCMGQFSNNAPNFNFDTGTPYFLYEGDEIFLEGVLQLGFTSISCGFSNFVPQVDFALLNPSDIKIQLMDNQMHEGMTWDFVNYISSDQCNDYILSLAKMFNLFFEFDPIDQTTLIIEPRKDFYNGEVIDWTYKFDRSNEYEFVPMSDITNQRLHFLYRNDSDYWNNKYQTENISTNKFSLLSQMTYGEYTYYFDNDFIDQASEDKIDLIFAPTPLVQDFYYLNPLTGGTYYSSTKVISTAYQEQYDQTTGNITKSPLNSFAPRILFYNGLLPCDQWGMYDYPLPYNKAIYAQDLSIYSATSTWQFVDFPHNVLTEYPYAGHLDNPYEPNQDLNFTYPAEYFYVRTGVTNSNLFNNYWFDMVQDMEDTSAKLLTGYFKLDTSDIQSLSFRNVIYLDGSYWIINKIIDYNPLDNSLTQVELLKMINYYQLKQSPKEKTLTVNSRPNVIPVGTTPTIVPIGTNTHNRTIIGGVNNWNIKPPTNNIIRGWGNTIDPTSINNLVIGDSNVVSPNIHHSIIIGSGIGLINGTAANTDLQPHSINAPIVNLIGNNGQINWNGQPFITITPTGVNIAGTDIQNINLIDAGQNLVLNEFSTSNNINLIDSGYNQVRGFGSASITNNIESGIDSIL